MKCIIFTILNHAMLPYTTYSACLQYPFDLDLTGFVWKLRDTENTKITWLRKSFPPSTSPQLEGNFTIFWQTHIIFWYFWCEQSHKLSPLVFSFICGLYTIPWNHEISQGEPILAKPAREQDEGGALHQPRLLLTHVASSLIHHLHSLGILGIGIVPPRSWGIIWYHPSFDCRWL